MIVFQRKTPRKLSQPAFLWLVVKWQAYFPDTLYCISTVPGLHITKFEGYILHLKTIRDHWDTLVSSDAPAVYISYFHVPFLRKVFQGHLQSLYLVGQRKHWLRGMYIGVFWWSMQRMEVPLTPTYSPPDFIVLRIEWTHRI